MICDTCHGTGTIWSGEYHDGRGLRAGKMIPCPDCTGGVAHCCDGLQEQPEPDLPEEKPSE